MPLSILWLGIGTLSVVFITFLAAFFAVLVNTIAGARSVDKQLVRAAQSLGASRRRLMTNVILPIGRAGTSSPASASRSACRG